MIPFDLAYRSFGGENASPLIILHGLFGAGRNWQGIARKLTDSHRVFLPDLRNHGASKHSRSMDYPHLVADLLHFLDSQEIESAAVMGHSMGGKVAIWLALTAPERVSRLVAVDIAPVKYNHSFNDIMEALLNLPVDEIQSRKQADDWLSKSIQEAGLRQFLLQNLVFENDRYRWRIDLEIFDRSLPDLLDFPPLDDLDPYPGETLMIGGARSRYLLSEYSDAISKTASKARIEIIPDAGHWVHSDQPEIFLKMVSEFLNQGSLSA